MNNRTFYTLIPAVVLILNAYPLYQLGATGGYLFYMNAHDESSYLQYDFSGATQSATRISQYLVTAGHEIGLSGGYINLLFDLVCLPVFIVFAARCFSRIGFDRRTANLYAFLLAALPLFFGGLNPVVRTVFEWSRATGHIWWLTSPEAVFLPLVRTPEPQFSLVVLAVAVDWSLKKNCFWYLYPVLPFLYPFVGIPATFILVALHVRQLLPVHRWAPLISWLLIAAAVWVFTRFLISDETAGFLTATHWPLVSLTAIECLLILLWGYRRCRPDLRPLLVAVASAPPAVANLQIITGRLVSANAYEQYFGTVCAVMVLLLSLDFGRETGPCRTDCQSVPPAAWQSFAFPRLFRWGLCCGCIGLVVVSGRNTFRDNYAINANFPLTPDLLHALRSDSGRVVIDNQRLAAVTNMIFPGQASTLLGYERSFAAVCTQEGVNDYLRAREDLLADETLAPRFERLLRMLDDAYRYEGEDFFLLHNGRKTHFPPRHNVHRVPTGGAPADLHVVLIEHKKQPRPRNMVINWMKKTIAHISGATYQ